MFSTRVFVLEETSTSRRPLKTSLFPPECGNLLLNTESGSLLFDERRTRERERERVLSRLLAVPRSIAHQFYSFGKRVRRCCLVPSRRGNQSKERDQITSRERERETHTHTHKVIMATKVQRIMTQPINLIFRFLQTKSRVQIWLYEHAANGDVLEGQIVGFDEYMRSRLGRLRGGETRERRETKDERRQSFVERRFGHHDG